MRGQHDDQMRQPMKLAVLIATAAIGVAIGTTLDRVRAEPLPAFDRSLIERIVRAQEAQARALESLTRATEKCRR